MDGPFGPSNLSQDVTEKRIVRLRDADALLIFGTTDQHTFSARARCSRTRVNLSGREVMRAMRSVVR